MLCSSIDGITSNWMLDCEHLGFHTSTEVPRPTGRNAVDHGHWRSRRHLQTRERRRINCGYNSGHFNGSHGVQECRVAMCITDLTNGSRTVAPGVHASFDDPDESGRLTLPYTLASSLSPTCNPGWKQSSVLRPSMTDDDVEMSLTWTCFARLDDRPRPEIPITI